MSDKNTQKYATYCITFLMTYVDHWLHQFGDVDDFHALAVQNRALRVRFFLGVGRYASNAAVNGDSGWDSIYLAQLAMRNESMV